MAQNFYFGFGLMRDQLVNNSAELFAIMNVVVSDLRDFGIDKWQSGNFDFKKRLDRTNNYFGHNGRDII